ncbi:MAG: hypothetical protein GY853_15425 [PVC group bacterium]|nr:hypothetical protein [PVC group bacterium]
MKADRKFIEKTRQYFSSHDNDNIGKEAAREAVENITGFFDILASWDRRLHSNKNNVKSPK